MPCSRRNGRGDEGADRTMTSIAVVTGNPKPQSRTHSVALAVADAVAAEFGNARAGSSAGRLVVDLAEHAPRLFDWHDPELSALTSKAGPGWKFALARLTRKAFEPGNPT